MIRLLEQRDGAARMVLPAGQDPAGWHQVLTAEIAAHLTPAHAALLATPERGETSTTWHAPGSAMRRFGDLDAADRDRLTHAIAAILSDIRRLAESGAAQAVAAAWPALRTVPDMAHVFAVDGGPVLAGWGFAAPAGGLGPLAALDDGVPWRAAPRPAWAVYAGTLAALAALAFFVGLVLAPLGGWIMPSPTACHAAPGDLALMLEQAREAARTDALKTELAQLGEARGDRALQCPIPQQMVAPPPPPPRADLPRDRWDKHDLGMLKGCWNNYTHMTLQDERTHAVLPVKTWRFCFDDEHGHGHQTITLQNGDRCENDLTASFDRDNSLQMLDASKCPFPNRPLRRGRLTCRWESASEAACMRRDLEGPAAGSDQPGQFRRADAARPGSGDSGADDK
jgi:hypothetical protein